MVPSNGGASPISVCGLALRVRFLSNRFKYVPGGSNALEGLEAIEVSPKLRSWSAMLTLMAMLTVLALQLQVRAPCRERRGVVRFERAQPFHRRRVIPQELPAHSRDILYIVRLRLPVTGTPVDGITHNGGNPARD